MTTKKFVYIKGAHFGNKGSELMFLAINQFIVMNRPDISVVLAPCKYSSYEQRINYFTYQLLNISKGKYDLNILSYIIPRFIRRFLNNNFGIVFESDLTAILDASGFAYGDNWPIENSARAKKQVNRLNKNSGKYIFLPQAFGPFSRRKERYFINKALSNCDMHFTRDSTSKKYLEKIGIETNVESDFTSLVETKLISQRTSLTIVPNSNMLNGSNGWSKQLYIDSIIQIVDCFVENFDEEVYVMNHEAESDLEICNSLFNLINNKYKNCSLIEPKTAIEAKQILGSSRMVFSSRYHACISALSSGVVCFSTSWSHKYEELYKDYDVSELLLKPHKTIEHKPLMLDILKRINNIECKLVNYALKEKSNSYKVLMGCINEI